MFHPDFRLGAPTGGELLAELGIRPELVREIAEDDRAIRCPEQGAVFPERRLADLFAVPASPSAARRWRRA